MKNSCGMSKDRPLLGAVEAGGTKMVCAVAHQPGEVLDELRFPTTTPDETLARVASYFNEMEARYGSLSAIGYGTFGPAVVRQTQKGYGTILPTPKPGWAGADVLGFLKRHFPHASMAFDTDVNAAAIGEGYAGAARGLTHFVYVTIGTGIGGGVVVDSKALHASPHAEIGHMYVPRLDDYAGCCSFHAHCLEGLASGSAIGARWGQAAPSLPAEHPAWELEASYLAMMVQNLVACYAPEMVILGGGVMEQSFLLDRVRTKYQELAAGYWSEESPILVTPALGNQAGITGALVMAERALSA